MPITFNWKFGPLEGRNKSGMFGVVETVHWRVDATDEASGLTDWAIGTVSLPEPDPDTFTALDAADQAVRRGWVEAAEPELIATTEAALTGRLQALIEAAASEAFHCD